MSQSQGYPLSNFREGILEKNIFLEFNKLVRRYLEAKELLRKESFLDSLYRVHQSLHHSARLAVMINGEEPDLLLWEQVKEIDSSVYKLYEELITSMEPLDKRIELFLLALDFSILSKLEPCANFLLSLLRSRREPWSANEIANHPAIKDQAMELRFILDKLVARSLLRTEIIRKEGIKEIKYSYYV